jgi:hypothetical protein
VRKDLLAKVEETVHVHLEDQIEVIRVNVLSLQVGLSSDS